MLVRVYSKEHLTKDVGSNFILAIEGFQAADYA